MRAWWAWVDSDKSEQQALDVVNRSRSNVAALIELVEGEALPGAAPLERVRAILRLTAKGMPGLHTGLFPPDDSGFRPELADGHFYHDPTYWSSFLKPSQRSTAQVGHFLSALDLRLKRWPRFVKLRLIVGHEKLGDRRLAGWVRQFLRATAADQRLFLLAVEHDRAGDDRQRDGLLHHIFGSQAEALRDAGRLGNSLPDLRLSVKGWRFGEALLTRELRTRAEAGQWLRREIYAAERVRPTLRTGVY